jgi:hypothetical protein
MYYTQKHNNVPFETNLKQKSGNYTYLQMVSTPRVKQPCIVRFPLK